MSSRYSLHELYTFFKIQIIKPILINTDYKNIKIIRAYSNSPAPREPYLTMNINNIKNSKKIVTDLDINDNRDLIYSKNFDLRIYGVGVDGYDILDSVNNALQLLDIKSIFVNNQIALNTISNIQQSPTLIEDEFDISYYMDLNIGYASSITEKISTIETVGYSYTIK